MRDPISTGNGALAAWGRGGSAPWSSGSGHGAAYPGRLQGGESAGARKLWRGVGSEDLTIQCLKILNVLILSLLRHLWIAKML